MHESPCSILPLADAWFKVNIFWRISVHRLFSEGKGLLKSVSVGEGIKILGRFHGSQIKAIHLV